MIDCARLLEEGDKTDKMQGYINKKAFNPYKAAVRIKGDFEYLCPNTTTLPTQGHFGSNDKAFEYVKISIRRCLADDLKDEPPEVDILGKPLNECFADNDMYHKINIPTMNSNIDFSQSDIDDVVTYGMQQEVIQLDPKIQQNQNWYYMKSKVEVSDDLYLLFQN